MDKNASVMRPYDVKFIERYNTTHTDDIYKSSIFKLFTSRSAVYSDRARTCRLSRYNQKDGMRLLYDPDFDYYENLMRKYWKRHITGI